MAAVQQVNNTLAREAEKRPNELLEGVGVAERMDTGTEKQAIEAHSRLEALEEVQRSKNSGREEEILAKRLQGEQQDHDPRNGQASESPEMASQ